MRILIANWSCRRAGGTETYLGRIMSRLAGRGTRSASASRWTSRMAAADSAAGWRAARSASSGRSPGARHDSIVATGRHLCPRAARARDEAGCSNWRRRCSRRTRITAPAFPVRRRTSSRSSVPAAGASAPPVSRSISRRCGGLSPLTMVTAHDRQRRRLALLDRYGCVVTVSAHMSAEFLRHGVAADGSSRCRTMALPTRIRGGGASVAAAPGAPFRMMFVGRMDRLKGGRVLLDALPAVRGGSGRRAQLTFAGDGPVQRERERNGW